MRFLREGSLAFCVDCLPPATLTRRTPRDALRALLLLLHHADANQAHEEHRHREAESDAFGQTARKRQQAAMVMADAGAGGGCDCVL